LKIKLFLRQLRGYGCRFPYGFCRSGIGKIKLVFCCDKACIGRFRMNFFRPENAFQGFIVG
jgi:hypothetical protein